MKTPKITLEQWMAFKTIVETGTYGKAAELMNKSQSSVSYVMSKLEEQLPTPVLRVEGRKTVLTEAGEVLYRRAVKLLETAKEIEQLASCLSQGWETTISINADSIVPIPPILQAVENFSTQSPLTRITLLESTLSGTDENILARQADLVLTAHIPPGFSGRQITSVSLNPVVHVNHLLARTRSSLSRNDLLLHRQIVLRDTGRKRTQDAGWLESEQRLTVSSFDQAIQAIERGLGFGFVPLHLVQEMVNQNQFVILDVENIPKQNISIYLISTAITAEGPAIELMKDLLKKRFDRNT